MHISNLEKQIPGFTGFGSFWGVQKPEKEQSKGLVVQGLVNMYIISYLGGGFSPKDTYSDQATVLHDTNNSISSTSSREQLPYVICKYSIYIFDMNMRSGCHALFHVGETEKMGFQSSTNTSCESLKKYGELSTS